MTLKDRALSIVGRLSRPTLFLLSLLIVVMAGECFIDAVWLDPYWIGVLAGALAVHMATVLFPEFSSHE